MNQSEKQRIVDDFRKFDAGVFSLGGLGDFGVWYWDEDKFQKSEIERKVSDLAKRYGVPILFRDWEAETTIEGKAMFSAEISDPKYGRLIGYGWY